MHPRISWFVLVFLWLAFLPSSSPLSPLPLNLVLKERKSCTACDKARVRTKVHPRRWQVCRTAAGMQCHEKVPGRDRVPGTMDQKPLERAGTRDRLYRQ